MSASRASPGGMGLLLVLATALISGVSTYVNLFAVPGTSSDAFVTVRNLLVAVAIAPMALFVSGGIRSGLTSKQWGQLALIGLVGGSIPFLLFFHGLALAAAAKGGPTASFFYRTLFLMATTLGVVVLGERARPRVALAALLLLVGNAFLLSLTSAVWVDGTGFVLVATVLWAVEYTLSKHALRSLSSGTVAFGRMGFGALFLVAYLGISGQLAEVSGFSGGQWVWILISAAFLTAFVATWYTGLKHVELGTAASVLVLGFPVTYLLSVAFDGARMTTDQALGVVAIAVGLPLAVGYTLLRDAWGTLARFWRGADAPTG